MIAVRRGCDHIPELPDSPEKYQKVFEFRGCVIIYSECCGEEENTFFYYDMSLANDEAVDFFSRR